MQYNILFDHPLFIKTLCPFSQHIVNIIINYHKGGLTQCYHNKIRILHNIFALFILWYLRRD